MPVPVSGFEKERFIRAQGDELRTLEQQYHVEKRDVVNELIERTCCSEEPALQTFIGGKGSDEERLSAVLRVLDSFQAELADE
ncbi:hypothetical protein [Pseudomonas cedrina]|uniref:hypothetical protein n=1 Tax=Pseudomonas cedrina TaxID=651740 RepID=UPI002786184B|nr:hypothetical protein [Pseudomonas cedrina]MDQ0655218.1 hypothetical protein [Pseudomonas cedrina]